MDRRSIGDTWELSMCDRRTKFHRRLGTVVGHLILHSFFEVCCPACPEQTTALSTIAAPLPELSMTTFIMTNLPNLGN
jgi:hypothetical protein